MGEQVAHKKLDHSQENVSSHQNNQDAVTGGLDTSYAALEQRAERPSSSLAQTVNSLSTARKNTRSALLVQIQRTHGNRYAQRVIAALHESSAEPNEQPYAVLHGSGSTAQRREVQNDNEIRGAQDWTTRDREGNTQRWKDACLANLNAVDSSQYVRIVERRDFYRWFYEYTAARGFATRWALAARVVADGAHQIADMDVDHAVANDTLNMASVELQGAMREGNQVIFDNVLPKLKRLLDGGPLTGRAALEWDMQILADEQNLVQPMYSAMSQESKDQIDYIARKTRFAGVGAHLAWSESRRDDYVPAGPNNNAGIVPAFDQPNIQNPTDRWRYGMGLGNTFTPGGSGYNPATDTMPAAGSGYTDGSEFRNVDNRHNLHELDAWLNPNRLSRTGAGSDLQAIIIRLSAFEKQQVLADHSPDGWAYSTQFAQFLTSEAVVRQALPTDPANASAVSAFMARYNAEYARVQRQSSAAIPLMVP